MRRAAASLVLRDLRGLARGSVMLTVLFLCLAMVVLIQTIVGVAVLINESFAAERSGRSELEAKERALAEARRPALLNWAPGSWEDEGDGSSHLQVDLAEVPASQDWLIQASANDPGGSPVVLSALIERGRDGLDLPLASVVAAEVVVPPERSTPWLQSGSDGVLAEAYLVRAMQTAATSHDSESGVAGVQSVGSSCSVKSLGAPWRLDDGWRQTLEAWGKDVTADKPAPGVSISPTQAVVVLVGSPGQTVRLSDAAGPLSPGATDRQRPALILVCGGAWLDLRDRGDLWGVVVVDGGGIRLEGTLLHGALFVTQEVDLGWTGAVVHDRAVLRWAADRSLWRARLLPGSRKEHLK